MWSLCKVCCHGSIHARNFVVASMLCIMLINMCMRQQSLIWRWHSSAVVTCEGVLQQNMDHLQAMSCSLTVLTKLFIYFAALQKKDEVPKWGIIIPIAPFGMPEYDGGERFDLRLPHVDNGWVDEDAAFGKTMARIFRWQKKEDKEAMNGKPGNALKGKTGKGKK